MSSFLFLAGRVVLSRRQSKGRCPGVLCIFYEDVCYPREIGKASRRAETKALPFHSSEKLARYVASEQAAANVSQGFARKAFFSAVITAAQLLSDFFTVERLISLNKRTRTCISRAPRLSWFRVGSDSADGRRPRVSLMSDERNTPL